MADFINLNQFFKTNPNLLEEEFSFYQRFDTKKTAIFDRSANSEISPQNFNGAPLLDTNEIKQLFAHIATNNTNWQSSEWTRFILKEFSPDLLSAVLPPDSLPLKNIDSLTTDAQLNMQKIADFVTEHYYQAYSEQSEFFHGSIKADFGGTTLAPFYFTANEMPLPDYFLYPALTNSELFWKCVDPLKNAPDLKFEFLFAFEQALKQQMLETKKYFPDEMQARVIYNLEKGERFIHPLQVRSLMINTFKIWQENRMDFAQLPFTKEMSQAKLIKLGFDLQTVTKRNEFETLFSDPAQLKLAYFDNPAKQQEFIKKLKQIFSAEISEVAFIHGDFILTLNTFGSTQELKLSAILTQ